MTLHGLTYVSGPLNDDGGAVEFAGTVNSYAQIENTANTNLIPVTSASYTILLQVCVSLVNLCTESTKMLEAYLYYCVEES